MNDRSVGMLVVALVCSIVHSDQSGNCSLREDTRNLAEVVAFIIKETANVQKMAPLVKKDILKVINDRDQMMRGVYLVLNRLKAATSRSREKSTIQVNKTLFSDYNNLSWNIDYFVHRFKFLPFKKRPAKLKEAERLLKIDNGIQKWLFGLKSLFMGRFPFGGVSTRPLIFQMIEHLSRKHGCSDDYKSLLDGLWRNMILSQCQGFILWAHALQIKGESVSFIKQYYKSTISTEVSIIANDTCDLAIDNAINLKCTDGFYCTRHSEFKVQCKPNYYISFKPKTEFITCEGETPKCLPCHCNDQGSTQSECKDETGMCLCDKNHYFGLKCQDRDCRWTSWSTWGACSKACGYGLSYRRRAHAMDKKGIGKLCDGENEKSKTCFHKCCDKKYHCQKDGKCISERARCNAIKDCGSGEDESKCDECNGHQTHFYSVYHVIYHDGHNVACPNVNTAIQSFKIKTNEDKSKLRYSYDCCQMKKDVCTRVFTKTEASNHPKGYFTELSPLPIQCKHDGFLQQFVLRRPTTTTINYHITCCEIKSTLKKKVRCYEDKTPVQSVKGHLITEMGGTNVKCRKEYYLNSLRFIFDSKKKKWNYAFRCCSVMF